MSGVAGIVLFKPVSDAESILQRMSNALRHRGDESRHQFIHSENSMWRAIVSIRVLEQNAILVDSSPSHLHIVDSASHSEGFQKNEHLWDLNTYNTLVIQINSDGLRIFRSSDGICGLYYAQTESAIFFASEKKSIWTIPQDNVKLLEPGCTLSVAWDGKKDIIQPLGLERPKIDENIDKVTAIKILEKALVSSFNYLSPDRKCAVLFSGGVDSALAAQLARKYCKETLLISAVCEGSHDEVAAVRAAELIGSRNIMVKIDADALWNALPYVIYSIETCKSMHVEIALPFFLAAEVAKQRGFSLIVSGQGPDELFAGYARHERLMKEKGSKAVEDGLWNEILVTHEINIQRDARAIAAHGLDVFFPYLYPPFVKIAMSLPATLKVDLFGVPSRKTIFRELAKHLGVPSEITMAPKRATQYSSGISRLLYSTVIERVEGAEKTSKREIPQLVQDALDTIANYLQMPIGTKGYVANIDLEATRKLMKRLGISASSD